MINKQGVWFVTLFSLIIVLSIYYVTIKDNDLVNLKAASDNSSTKANVEVEESSILVSLRVKDEEDTIKEMEDLQTVLLDETASLQEKNDAYNSLQTLNNIKGKEEMLENKIKNKLELNSFVKIKDKEINVTVDKKEHNKKIANDIIRLIQEEYEEDMYITVKFEAS